MKEPSRPTASGRGVLARTGDELAETAFVDCAIVVVVVAVAVVSFALLCAIVGLSR